MKLLKILNKYMLQKYDENTEVRISEMFAYCFTVLKMMGLMGYENMAHSAAGYVIKIIAIGIVNSSQILYLVYKCRSIEEFSACYVMLICLQTALKLFIFLYQFDNVVYTINCFNDILCQPKCEKHRKLLFRAIRFCIIFGTIVYISSTLAITTFIFTLSEDENEFVTEGYFLMEITGYQVKFVNFFQMVGLYFFAYVTSSLEYLNGCFLVMIGVQIRFLSETFASICEENNLLPDKSVKDQFRYSIRYHSYLLHMVFRINKYLERLTFVQFLFASICIGCVIFRLSEGKHPNEMLRLVLIGTLLTVQLVIYCLLGTAISDESLNLDMGIYKSNWIDLPLQYRKDILIMMLRTQTPVAFTGLGIFSLSTPTLLSILKSAFSCYTLLSDMH